MDATTETIELQDKARAEEIASHFRNNWPVMLDGALAESGARRSLLRHARESLARPGKAPDSLPAAVLRETLDAVRSGAARSTGVRSGARSGLTAVGPKTGRVWWDASVLDNLDDVIARLDSPRAVLRFYDVTGVSPESGRWNDFFDIDVDLDAGGRTIDFWSGDRAYVVDLGYIYADGRFLRLARTNFMRLPREGAGERDFGDTVRTVLGDERAAGAAGDAAPDSSARAWAAGRRDHGERDLDTELIIHMLYRSFLNEGPRALRRSPRLFRRDPELLRREFAQRERAREREAAARRAEQSRDKAAAPAFLVVRLDGSPKAAAPQSGGGSVFLPAIVARSPAALSAVRFPNPRRQAWFGSLLAAAFRVSRTGELPDSGDGVQRVETENEDALPLVARMSGVAAADRSVAYLSKSVFETAKNLRESLVTLPSLDDELDVAMDLSEALEAGSPESPDSGREKDDAARIFGGSEARRMAKAGVRITRMALTLEGRMRPGARLKVAGKLVHADENGHFRLECVLTGRRASIPMRAGASIGGEARSLINVEWERRIANEKKKAW